MIYRGIAAYVFIVVGASFEALLERPNSTQSARSPRLADRPNRETPRMRPAAARIRPLHL